MRISQITVSGLFNFFNHDLAFKSGEPVTIMIGPNGFGKTMILRLINALFNLPIQTLSHFPFKTLVVTFDDGSTLHIAREYAEQNTLEDQDPVPIRLQYTDATSGTYAPYVPPPIRADDLAFPLGSVEELVPSLSRVGPDRWARFGTGEVLGISQVIATYGETLPWDFGPSGALPSWLTGLLDAIPVKFIGTERLTYRLNVNTRTSRHRRQMASAPTDRTIRRYSEALAQHINNTLAQYANLSQSLDRTFPARVVEEPTTTAPPPEEIQQRLADVEERRSNIVDAGLLVQEDHSLGAPLVPTLDPTRLSVLAVYAQDARQKLNVFDDLYSRVESFKRIANSRLLFKDVTISVEGLAVSALDGSPIELETLSSGEQHELVLLYDLLFDTSSNSLILIDEPELSLHVAWQDELLTDLQEIAHLSGFQALLATHSPQIIGDRWDLTVELKGPQSR